MSPRRWLDKASASPSLSFFTDVYFRPLIQALKAVGRDQMGRVALKADLKKVVVTRGLRGEGQSLQNGVLTRDYRALTAAGDVALCARDIQQTLEGVLEPSLPVVGSGAFRSRLAAGCG